MIDRVKWAMLGARIEAGESGIFAEFGPTPGEPLHQYVYKQPQALGGLAVNPLVPTAISIDGVVSVAVWLDAARWPTPAHYLREIQKRRAGRVVLRRCGGTEQAHMLHIDQLTTESRVLLVHSRAGEALGEYVPAIFATFPIARLSVTGPYAAQLGAVLRRALAAGDARRRLGVFANTCSLNFEV